MVTMKIASVASKLVSIGLFVITYLFLNLKPNDFAVFLYSTIFEWKGKSPRKERILASRKENEIFLEELRR